MRSLAVSTLVLSVALIGSACGPGPGSELGPQNAATAGQAMASTVQSGAEFARSDATAPRSAASDATLHLSPATSLIGMDPHMQAGPGCWTASGDGSDPDQDGLPNNVTVTYDCSDTVGNNTATLTGDVYFQDTQPNTYNPFEFTGGVTDLRAGLDNDVQNIHGFIMENWSVTASQTGANLQLDEVGSLQAEDHRPNRDNVMSTSQNLTHVLDVLARTLTVNGDWSIDVNGHTAATTLATTPNVHFEETCETSIDSGGITGTYQDSQGRDATISVSWTGCGTYTITYNGEVVGDQNS